jgi:TonB family protein
MAVECYCRWKFCYDNALKKSAGLAGKLTLQMDIAASGEVVEVHVVHDGLGDEALQRCIRTQVAAWRFPAIEAGTVRFTLPLVFSPPNG